MGLVNSLLAAFRLDSVRLPGLETAGGRIVNQAGDENGGARIYTLQLPSALGSLTKALSLSVCLASDSLLAPPTKATAITASDATDLTTIAPIGITIGVGGTLVARFAGAPTTSVTMTVQAGQFVYGQFVRVMAATTATGIVGWAP